MFLARCALTTVFLRLLVFSEQVFRRSQQPVNILSMAMAGASAPISVSGTLVTHNAEVLAGITLAQVTNPGAPVWYGSSTTTFDMKVGTATVGAPEMGMISSAAVGLANYYNLPSYVGGL